MKCFIHTIAAILLFASCCTSTAKGNEPYNITTRMFTADADEVFDEIFEPEIKVELPM